MKDQENATYDTWLSKHGGYASSMTIRDYFAANALALTPDQTAYNMKDNESYEAYRARRAYAIADAMLKERGDQ